MSETAVVTLLFCDMVGSTELLTSLGDDANDEVRRSLFSALERVVSGHGGTVVKSAGDGMMVSFRASAADAVACAIAMQRAVPNRAGWRPPRPRIARGDQLGGSRI